MDKGKYNVPGDHGDNGTDRNIGYNDTNRLFEDVTNSVTENLINTKIVNIDTMRKESKDSDSIIMDIKDDKKENIDTDIKKSETDWGDSGPSKVKPSAIWEKMLGLINKIFKNLEATWNGYVDISKSNLIFPVAFIIGTIIYLEIIVHLLIYRSIDIKIMYPVLFAVPIGTMICFITGLFQPIINKILLLILTGLTCLIFAAQLVYFYIFKVYFSFHSLGMAGDAVSEFGSDAMTAIKANIFGIILMFIPLIILMIINSYFDYRRRGLKLQVILFGTSVLFHVVAVVALLLCGKSDYTPYDLYHNSKVQDLCGKQLGISTMTRLDIGNLLSGNSELVLADAMYSMPTNIPTPVAVAPVNNDTAKPDQLPEITLTPTPVTIDTSPNIMDIDFNALAENETNDTIKMLHNYFASATGTNKNEYSGMFKGYNLIQITAEGFSPYAVNEEKTPTLYKLVHEGFVFNNFYTALWQTSTSDGEYAALTGLIPTGTRNMYNGRNNLWPFALGNQFDKLGVASKAYHDHTYTYYQRNETHPNLGYIFKAKGNGLVLEHPNTWPESDVEMINSTVDEYVNEDQFHVYYLTVSGHMNYTFEGNYISYKNRDLVADLPYSEDVKAYIACQIELDRALEQLIKKLEDAGVADRTVIALSADHYPYAWDKSILDEAAGHVVEPNFETYKNHFILWCEGMDENVVIDEPCSSLDILPTLTNLFGIEYDSRLLMGQDILSDAPPLAILSNRSFITDKVMYNSETGEVTKLTQEALPKDYISNINKIIKNKFMVSETILKEDYYWYIFGDSEE
ncbi:MAG: LTA synthase family protein [Herbinix sp.]|nr:LTA synthase family protein [Herbinix sp.]